MCGKPIRDERITERRNDTLYVFDKEQCVLTFKKLESIYGAGFLS